MESCRTNIWILSIGRKETTSIQKVLEYISIQKLTACRDKDIIRTNLQENKCIFNKIRHIQVIGNKIFSLSTKNPTPDHIKDVVKSPLRFEWHDSIFSNYEKMTTSTTFSALFLRSLLPPETKILIPRIYFRVKTTDIDNQYDLY